MKNGDRIVHKVYGEGIFIRLGRLCKNIAVCMFGTSEKRVPAKKIRLK